MHQTQRTLKDRDRENRLYNPALEGHRNPLFASVLPNVEILTFLAIVFLSGIGAVIAGLVVSGVTVIVISGALLCMAGWVRLTDPAKRRH